MEDKNLVAVLNEKEVKNLLFDNAVAAFFFVTLKVVCALAAWIYDLDLGGDQLYHSSKFQFSFDLKFYFDQIFKLWILSFS